MHLRACATPVLIGLGEPVYIDAPACTRTHLHAHAHTHMHCATHSSAPHLCSFWTHAWGLVFAIVGTILMLFKSTSAVASVSALIYGGCNSVLFFASSLHHTVKRPASNEVSACALNWCLLIHVPMHDSSTHTRMDQNRHRVFCDDLTTYRFT